MTDKEDPRVAAQRRINLALQAERDRLHPLGPIDTSKITSWPEEPPEFGARPWRVGRQVGRTIYDAGERLIGMLDTPELARLVVDAVNASET